MKSYNLLMGTSGTGKGTRVSQLMSFLITESDIQLVTTKNKKGKIVPFGYYFKYFDIFVVGKVVVSHKSGLSSFTSLDYINSMTGKTDLTIEMVKNLTHGHVIAEGEPMLQSFKYRPIFMHEMYGVNSMSFHIFNYENREQYDKRIIGRSGKAPKGDGGWNRNHNYTRVYDKILEEFVILEAVGDKKFNLHAELYPHDAPITIFGTNMLMRAGFGHHVQKFVEHSKQYDTLRNVNN